MVTKKLETSRSWQHLELPDAKAIYSEEFPFRMYNELLRAFERFSYPGRSAGYDHIAKGVVITGSLMADRSINAALIAEKICDGPQIGQGAAYSLAIFLKMESISNDGIAGGKRLHVSSIFDDMETLSGGKRVRLDGPCPVDHEFAGEAIGATIKCMYKMPVDKVEGSHNIEVIVNDPLLEEVAMMLKRQLHDQIISIRK